MIGVVVVGYGLAGRSIHIPLIRRQSRMRLRGVVARNPAVRFEAERVEGAEGFESLEAALSAPGVDLVVIATPHDTHADLAVRSLQAGKHCVVDKVMTLTTLEADRMIAARDASRRMLGVFHNRRWDWDFLTVKSVLASGILGRPICIRNFVCREAPPRTWRGQSAAAGTILHDWGAHLVDQAFNLGLGSCQRLSAKITPAPWPGVDSGGSGSVRMFFPETFVVVETSRTGAVDPLHENRWWINGTEASYYKRGIDPQEAALRLGNLDLAAESTEEIGQLASPKGTRTSVPTVRGSWDSYYINVADHLEGSAPLDVTAEEGREVVRVLEAAVQSAEHGGRSIKGPWGLTT